MGFGAGSNENFIVYAHNLHINREHMCITHVSIVVNYVIDEQIDFVWVCVYTKCQVWL